MRPVPSLNTSLINHQKKKDDDLFLSQIFYPLSLLSYPNDALLIGWNYDSFDCVIAFYIPLPPSLIDLRVIDLALEKAFRSEFFSLSNYQNFSTPPKVLGEWRPKLSSNYMPHSNLRESLLWITLTKNNLSSYDQMSNSASRAERDHSSDKAAFFPHLFKLFSLNLSYNLHVYMVSYEDIDSSNFSIYNLPSLTDILLISSISSSSSSSSSYSSSSSSSSSSYSSKDTNFLNNLNDWRFFSLSNLPPPPSSLVSSLKFNHYLHENYDSLNFYEKFYSLVPFTLTHLANFVSTSSSLLNSSASASTSSSAVSDTPSRSGASSSSSSSTASPSLLAQLNNFNFTKLHRILCYINSADDLKRIFIYYYKREAEIIRESTPPLVAVPVSSAVSSRSLFPLACMVLPLLRLVFSVSHSIVKVLTQPYKALIWLHYLTLQGYFRSSYSTSSSALKSKGRSSLPGGASSGPPSDLLPLLSSSSLLKSKYYFLANYSNYLYELSVMLHNLSHLYQLALFFSLPRYHPNVRKLLYKNFMSILLRFLFHHLLGALLLYWALDRYSEVLAHHFTVFVHFLINRVVRGPLNYLIRQNNLSLNFIITYKVGVILLNVVGFYSRLLAILLRHIQSVFFLLSCLSFFNMVLFISLLLDFLNAIFFPITIVYWILCLQYRLHLDMISTLWLLFKGKKKNILRLRIDSSEFNQYQLLFSMILYTIMVFSLPNFIIFYYLFSGVKLFILLINFILWKTKHFLNTAKVYDLLLYLSLRHRDLLAEDATVNFAHVSSTSLFDSLVNHKQAGAPGASASKKREGSSSDPSPVLSSSLEHIAYTSGKRKNSIGRQEAMRHPSDPTSSSPSARHSKLGRLGRQLNAQTQFKLSPARVSFPLRFNLFFSTPLVLLLLKNVLLGQYLSLGLSSYTLRLRAHNLAKEYYLISHLVTFLLQDNKKHGGFYDHDLRDSSLGRQRQSQGQNQSLLFGGGRAAAGDIELVRETSIRIMKMTFSFDDFLRLLPSWEDLQALEEFFPGHLYYVRKLLWLLILVHLILFLGFLLSNATFILRFNQVF